MRKRDPNQRYKVPQSNKNPFAPLLDNNKNSVKPLLIQLGCTDNKDLSTGGKYDQFCSSVFLLLSLSLLTQLDSFLLTKATA